MVDGREPVGAIGERRRVTAEQGHGTGVGKRDTDDEVSDDGLDSAESSDIFAAAVVDLDRDNIFLGEGEADGKVGEIFCQFAWWRTSCQRS